MWGDICFQDPARYANAANQSGGEIANLLGQLLWAALDEKIAVANYEPLSGFDERADREITMETRQLEFGRIYGKMPIAAFESRKLRIGKVGLAQFKNVTRRKC